MRLRSRLQIRMRTEAQLGMASSPDLIFCTDVEAHRRTFAPHPMPATAQTHSYAFTGLRLPSGARSAGSIAKPMAASPRSTIWRIDVRFVAASIRMASVT